MRKGPQTPLQALSLFRGIRCLARRYLIEPGLNRADKSAAVAAPPNQG
jgi:hypothetical protein